MTCFVGLDLGLNRFGLTLIRRDESMVFVYGTTEAKFHKLPFPGIICTPCRIPVRSKEESKDIFDARRKEFLVTEILDQLRLAELSKVRTEYYVALEDYAYTSMTNNSYGLAEMVGIIKNYLWQHEYNLRLVDPSTLKLWATGKGSAYKKDMWKAAKSLVSTPLFDREDLMKEDRRRDSSIDLGGPITDLSDSTLLALFVQQEWQIRNKEIFLDHLVAHQKRAFVKRTKASPIEILARPFIRKRLED